jgi:N-acetylneuraminate lyase
MTASFNGVIPAIVSPCDDHDRFLEEAFVEQIHRVYKEGVHGVYVCGATGDALRMRNDDRKRAVALAVEASGPYNGTVIAHVGNESTRNAVELAEDAAKAGADAISSMPPFSTTPQQVCDFYATISRSVDLPLLVYHIPQITGIDTSVEQMLELLDIPNVIGIKCSGNDLMFLKRISMARPDTVLINGVDEKFTLGLLYGACGGIGMWYSIFPRLFLDIFEAVSRRDIDRALELQTLLVDLWQVALVDMRASFEMVLQMRGFGCRAFRRPHPVVNDQTSAMLQRELPSRVAAIDRANS